MYVASSRSLSGKIIVVTGGNTGIGKATCQKLAELGAEVILAARNAELGTKAAAMINLSVAQAKVVFMQLDLASFESIRQFADAFRAKYDRLDVLVNNAGIAYIEYGHTKDGFELQTGTNHLGHFLLTYELLPRLLVASAPRVVTVSSEAHRIFTPKFDRGCFTISQAKYSRFAAYAQSKLANVLFAKELQRRVAAIGSNLISLSLHPGTVATEVTRNAPKWMTLFIPAINYLFLKTPEEGAQTTLFGVCDPDLANHGGAYLDGVAVSKASQAAEDLETARLLWEDSERMCGVSPNRIAEFGKFVARK